MVKFENTKKIRWYAENLYNSAQRLSTYNQIAVASPKDFDTILDYACATRSDALYNMYVYDTRSIHELWYYVIKFTEDDGV